MPCPPPTPLSGVDTVTVQGRYSRKKAAAAARAAVPQAAYYSAIHEVLVLDLCPEDCPYPHATDVSYVILSVTTSWQTFVNTLGFGWFNALFGEGWSYSGTATYFWSATGHCREKRPTFQVLGYELAPAGQELEPPSDE